MFKKAIAIGLRVADFEKSLEFYTNILDLDVKTLDKENFFAELQIGSLVVALLCDKTLNEMCSSDYFSNDISAHLIAVEVANIEQAYEQLCEKGVTFVEKPKTTPWGQRVAYFKDLNGYIWEISEEFNEA